MSNGPVALRDFSDKVIIVTGAASGIGASAARLLASRGAAIVLADVDSKGGAQTLQAIKEGGGRALFMPVDVTREDDVAAMVRTAVSEFGGLHGAFNNAGITSPSSPFPEMPLSEWQRTIDINLTGVFLCMKHELAHMLAHGGGSIVNTSSGAGVVGFPNLPDYVASKHGVVGLTRAGAADFSVQGVRVNAILPGGAETPMLLGTMNSNPVVRAAVESGHPIGRLASPDEIAEAAVWLLSDAASFVTGACLAVDGGYTAV